MKKFLNSIMKMLSKESMVCVIILSCFLVGCDPTKDGDQCYGQDRDIKCYSYNYNLVYHDKPTVLRLPFYAEPLERTIIENLGKSTTEYVNEDYRGVKLTCLVDGNSFETNDNCPVLSWKGHVYWVYSNRSNWPVVSIVAASINAPRRPVKKITRSGGRYIVDIRKEGNEPLIVLVLQGNKEIKFTLDELRIE